MEYSEGGPGGVGRAGSGRGDEVGGTGSFRRRDAMELDGMDALPRILCVCQETRANEFSGIPWGRSPTPPYHHPPSPPKFKGLFPAGGGTECPFVPCHQPFKVPPPPPPPSQQHSWASLQISEAGLSLFCILGLAATHGVFRRCGPPTPTLVACVPSNREDTYLRHRQGGRKKESDENRAGSGRAVGGLFSAPTLRLQWPSHSDGELELGVLAPSDAVFVWTCRRWAPPPGTFIPSYFGAGV